MKPKEKFHELVWKLSEFCPTSLQKAQLNKIIVEWLEAKAVKLAEKIKGLSCKKDYEDAIEILGLTEEAKEPVGYTTEEMLEWNKQRKEKPVERKEWCQHINQCPCGSVGVSDSAHLDKDKVKWQYCPICGAKSPEPEKPRKLWEILVDEHINQWSNSGDDGKPKTNGWKSIAQVGITAVLEVWERWERCDGLNAPELPFPDFLKRELL